MPFSPLIGRNYATPDLIAKVTGRARYAEDFRAEGMLFAKLLLSPMPHARVRGVDTAAALALPGVRAVLTADDVPGATAPAEKSEEGFTLRAETALTSEPVYQGEPILAVAAVDEWTAAEAIEAVRVDLEPLPFVVDPLASLRPGGPNARLEGNAYVGDRVRTIKWTDQVFASASEGTLPMGEAGDGWSYGDLDAGFAAADLVLDETFLTPSTSHQPLESRTAMAYWQNGKCYLHGSTQSVARTVASAAGWIGIKPEELVLISEYTGGGFGSKIPGAHSMAIPALLSKKLNGRPVMMRISREEETYIGRTRPGYTGWIKMGFKKDGRVTACDVFVVEAAGPYRRQGDHATSANNASLMYQVPNMRFRGVSVATNTPPGTSQRAPGGLQASVMFEPMIDEAARKLNLDRVAIRKINAPEGQALFGLVPANSPPGRPRNKLTSCFLKECLDKGAEMFNWEERKKRSGQRNGNKVTGVAVASGSYTAGSIGVDGLCVIKPDGKLYIHQGIGNLGTHSVIDTARVIAEQVDMPWEKCEVVWGDTSKGVAWSSVQAGSQTTYAHTRANYAAGQALKRTLQELAAAEMGGAADDYDVGNERVFRKGNPGRAIPFAKAAELAIKRGGKFDGHELPKEINAMTRASATALAGLGLMGVARDNLPRDGQTYSFQTAFIEIEVDVETGAYRIVDYLAVVDVGTVIHPNSLAGQVHGGGVQGFGHVRSQKLVYDPHYGAALANRLHNNKPPTILDIPVEQPMRWAAVELPDPTNPVGAKGIGEPAIGAGGGALICALADAVGDGILRRTPVHPEQILMSLAAGKPAYEVLTAFI
jgi:CO/xanthine dehydrogenase Mo-binding subunit